MLKDKIEERYPDFKFPQKMNEDLKHIDFLKKKGYVVFKQM
jgi:hypothetical protein